MSLSAIKIEKKIFPSRRKRSTAAALELLLMRMLLQQRFTQVKQLFPKTLTWTLKMSGTVKRKQDNAALLTLLAAISLALVTILSVWKLKTFKYRPINETGGAMLYGK